MTKNYRLIQEAKDRAIDRSGQNYKYEPKDVVAKIELNSGREVYKDGFSDYHGPNNNSGKA